MGDSRTIRLPRLERRVRYLARVGDYAQARVRAEEAYLLAGDLYGADDARTLTQYYNWAEVEYLAGARDRATAMYQTILRRCPPNWGIEGRVAAVAAFNLAGIFWERGKRAEAVDLYTRVASSLDPEPDPLYFMSLINIADIMCERGTPEDARELLSSALKRHVEERDADPRWLVIRDRLAGEREKWEPQEDASF